jgi:hypothetical protein
MGVDGQWGQHNIYIHEQPSLPHLLLEDDDDGVRLRPRPALLLLAPPLVLRVGGRVAREAIGVDLLFVTGGVWMSGGVGLSEGAGVCVCVCV